MKNWGSGGKSFVLFQIRILEGLGSVSWVKCGAESVGTNGESVR